jgi:hypothetical protein
MLVTPRKGAATIPIYGRAYPEGVVYPEGIDPQEFVPLQYAIPAGQIYVASGLTASDFYWSPTQTQRKVIAGHTPYYQIFFNHRVAFVRASDVDLVWQAAATQPAAAKGGTRP